MRAAAGRESPDPITGLAPLNRPAPLLPLLHKLVEERAGERRLPPGSWAGLPALPFRATADALPISQSFRGWNSCPGQRRATSGGSASPALTAQSSRLPACLPPAGRWTTHRSPSPKAEPPPPAPPRLPAGRCAGPAHARRSSRPLQKIFPKSPKRTAPHPATAQPSVAAVYDRRQCPGDAATATCHASAPGGAPRA